MPADTGAAPRRASRGIGIGLGVAAAAASVNPSQGRTGVKRERGEAFGEGGRESASQQSSSTMSGGIYGGGYVNTSASDQQKLDRRVSELLSYVLSCITST